MGAEIIGQVILGQYRVDSFIEAGGMGVVYRVWDLARSVPLAMKVLHEDFNNDPTVLKMFVREAEALTQLSHPHIVPFYGFFQTPEYAFFLERYIDGPSLKRVLSGRRGQPLEIGDSFIILKALAAALGYAHVNNLIHCDIKPGNVLIDQGGNIYLTDFGIARHALSTTTTMAGAGTPAYMAPEQIRGEPVTPATDVYTLGALWFEMITGRRPFLGSEPESEEYGPSTDQRIYFAHLNILPVDPARLNPNLSPALSQVVLKAMQKEPDQRYSSMQQMITAACQAAGVMQEAIPDRLTLGSGASPISLPRQTGGGTHPPVPQPTADTGSAVAGQPRKFNLPIALVVGSVIACLGLAALLVLGASLTNRLPAIGGLGTTRAPTATLDQVVAAVPPPQEVTATQTAQPAAALPFKATATRLSPTQTSRPSIVKTIKAAATATGAPVEYNAPLYTPLAGCAPSHVHVKDWVMITLGGGRNSIRSTADTHPTDNKIGYAEPGELINIIEGPVCNYGWLLWRVRTATGLEGWTPETDGKRFFLEPFPSYQACENSPASLLHKGDQAQVTQYPPVSNRLRSEPGIQGGKLGNLAPGENLVILDGPKCLDGYVWWKVRSDKGQLGWTAEGEKDNYFLVPVPQPHN